MIRYSHYNLGGLIHIYRLDISSQYWTMLSVYAFVCHGNVLIFFQTGSGKSYRLVDFILSYPSPESWQDLVRSCQDLVKILVES